MARPLGIRRAIEPLAHFLPGLEERHRLLADRHMRTGARIASGTRGSVLDRKRSEAAQLDTVPARHGGDDLAEDGVDDVLDVALVEVRVRSGDALHKLGLDHRTPPSVIGRLPTSRRWEGAKAPVDRQG